MEQNMHTKSTCNTSELEGLDPLSTDTSELSPLSDWSSSSPGRNNELRLLLPLSMCTLSMRGGTNVFQLRLIVDAGKSADVAA